MKRKNRYYDRYGEISWGYSIAQWFKGKDDHYHRWFTNTYLQNDLGIKLQPKHRHFRSIVKNKVNLLGSKDYEFLMTRSYMQKTRKRIYSRAQAFQQLQEGRQRLYKTIEDINVDKKNRVCFDM